MSSEVAEAVAAMIAERQRARVADHATRAASLAAFSAEVKKRRTFGLKRRYALKAARIQQQTSIT